MLTHLLLQANMCAITEGGVVPDTIIVLYGINFRIRNKLCIQSEAEGIKGILR